MYIEKSNCASTFRKKKVLFLNYVFFFFRTWIYKILRDLKWVSPDSIILYQFIRLYVMLGTTERLEEKVMQ